MNIIRIQASCMFFCEDHCEENVDFGPFDVCYQTNPRQPILVQKSVIPNDLLPTNVIKNTPIQAEKTEAVKPKLDKH